MAIIMSWKDLAAALITTLFAYTLYIVVSRIFLSPLGHIPGPRLAALTSWYEFYYDAIQQGKFVWKIKELHSQYGSTSPIVLRDRNVLMVFLEGPIIRITPWEIHINDVEFLDDIYAPSFRRRDKYAHQTRTLPVPLSLGGTVDHDLHRKRREALNPFFSKKSVQSLGPMIANKVEFLSQFFTEKSKSSTAPVNLSDIYFAFANDVVLQYSFGQDDDLLRAPARASTLRSNLAELLLGVKFNQHFPWIVDALEMLPMVLAKNIMPPGVLDMKDFSSKIGLEIHRVLEDCNDEPRGQKRSIFYALRDNDALPASEKSPLRLEHEGTLVVMAGTESTAKSLAITHFHLLANPGMMQKVRNELSTVPETASWSELEQLPYLSACIAEGNRLSLGVTARVCRIAPDETLRYKSYDIPPGTPVSMTSLCAHTDEHIFPDPWKFIPERWLGTKGVEKRKYQMAFNKGGRNCIGINLAHAELFLVMAAVLRYDMELFETDISDVEFQHDYQIGFPKLDSKGIRAVVKGKIDY